jgi:poly(hydroxyalkanoate) depolymerase family esterase
MHRPLRYTLALASSVCLLAVTQAHAAQVTKVERNVWGASGVPSYVTMYVYVPDQLADKPPVLVACHSCGTPVSGYVNSITRVRQVADQNGFIVILPEATGRNCWDVGTAQSLMHDGGGDTEAIVQMVQYTLEQYDGDASRVYVMGGSSGAMMTQALLAVYPDVFKAGSARAGVPAGCWADGFDPGQQWSGNCAGGRTTKSAQQWGDQARGMFPGYTGPRPRVQLFHGTNDTTIAYANQAEAIKQWTNVLGLDAMPTSTDSATTSVATYQRQFWENECGYMIFETWAGQNGTHSMAYEEDAILEFFGLDMKGGADPQPACPGAGGAGGAGGGGGSGNSAGAAAGGPAGGGAGGAGPGGGSGGAPLGGNGGNANVAGAGGGQGGAGGAGVSGASGANPGGAPGVSGGSDAAGGTTGVPGVSGSSSSGSAGRPPTASSGGTGGGSAGMNGAGDSSDRWTRHGGGCGIISGKGGSRPGPAALALLAIALFAARGRRGTRRYF